MLAKLAFVLVMEHTVFGLQCVIQYAIPNVPGDIALHLQRNRYISSAAAHRQAAAQREKKDAAKSVEETAPSVGGGSDYGDDRLNDQPKKKKKRIISLGSLKKRKK